MFERRNIQRFGVCFLLLVSIFQLGAPDPVDRHVGGGLKQKGLGVGERFRMLEAMHAQPRFLGDLQRFLVVIEASCEIAHQRTGVRIVQALDELLARLWQGVVPMGGPRMISVPQGSPDRDPLSFGSFSRRDPAPPL